MFLSFLALAVFLISLMFFFIQLPINRVSKLVGVLFQFPTTQMDILMSKISCLSSPERLLAYLRLHLLCFKKHDSIVLEYNLSFAGMILSRKLNADGDDNYRNCKLSFTC